MNTQEHKTAKISECLEITPVTIYFLPRVRYTYKTREDQSLTSHTPWRTLFSYFIFVIGLPDSFEPKLLHTPAIWNTWRFTFMCSTFTFANKFPVY